MHLPQINVLLNWRKEKNLTGKYSVYLRITLNRISKYYTIQLPEKVREDHWTGVEDAWVKKTHPFSFEINNKIQEKKFALHELIKRCYFYRSKFLNLLLMCCVQHIIKQIHYKLGQIEESIYLNVQNYKR